MSTQQQTPEEWLAELFEFEYCAECGGDAQHHTVCGGPFGNYFARCDYPPSPEPYTISGYECTMDGRIREFHEDRICDERGCSRETARVHLRHDGPWI